MKKAIQQAGILTFSNVLGKLLAMFFFVVLTRLMEVSEYGHLRYILNLAAFMSLALSGISTALTKFLREKPDDVKLQRVYLGNSLAIAGIFYAVIFVVAWIIYDYFLLFGILLFGIMTESFYLGFSRGLLNITKLSAFRPVKGILQLLAIGLFLAFSLKVGMLEAVILFSLSALAASLILEAKCHEMEFRPRISGEVSIKILKYAIPVTIGAVGWSGIIAVNPIVIEYFHGNESVAYYSVGVTLMQVFAFIPEAISTLVLPKVAGSSRKSYTLRPFILSVIGTILAGVIILIGVTLFKEQIVILIFSERYIDAAQILPLLALGQISLGTHQVIGSFWQGLGKPSIPSVTISIGFVLQIAGSLILTRSYGIWGASLSYAICTTISLVILAIYFVIKRKTIAES